MSKEQLEQRRMQAEWAKFQNPYETQEAKKSSKCVIS